MSQNRTHTNQLSTYTCKLTNVTEILQNIITVILEQHGISFTREITLLTQLRGQVLIKKSLCQYAETDSHYSLHTHTSQQTASGITLGGKQK